MTQSDESYEIAKGILLLLFVHMVAIATALLLYHILTSILSTHLGIVSTLVRILDSVFPFYLSTIGISQWLYVTPLLIRLRRRDKVGLFKGILIGALLTMLLNGICFASQFTSHS